MSEEQLAPEQAALNILERLRDGGVWQPAGLGLTYVRDGEKSITLVEQENNPTSAQARIRMRILVEGLGWTVDESGTALTDVQHLSPQERHMQEMMMRQEMAQNWKCECGTPLSAFDLEFCNWVTEGQREMILPDGSTEMVEDWHVMIECPVCSKDTAMEPYDYALLAGDDAMLVYDTGHVKYRALSRPEIIEKMDVKNGAPDVLILGTFCPFKGNLLPPHVRGAVVTWEAVQEEE